MTNIRRYPNLRAHVVAVVVLVAFHHLAGTQGGLVLQAQSGKAKVALEELSDAIERRDLADYLSRSTKVLALRAPRGWRLAVDGFADVVEHAKLGVEEYYEFHNSVAKVFAGVKSSSKRRALKKLQRKAPKWRSRLILLDAGALNGEWGTLELAFGALDDEAPQVVRRSLFYLTNITTSLDAFDDKLAALDRVLARYRAIEDDGKLKGGEWDRTRLAFQSTMRTILKVALLSAADYENYLSVRREDPQLFDPAAPEEGGRTALTLFGAPVTGKNIAFVIDVSGSMVATDTIEIVRKKGRTVVHGSKGEKKRLAELADSRRRITRARAQLTKVIRALPDGIRFNVIAYSSDVFPWRNEMTKCRRASRKKAIKFVDSMKAEGVTVTDLALEQAFMDVNIDTIYLITDGAPTHEGAGKGKRPPDADLIIGKIHRRLRVLNFLRGVRVFTLGFPDAHEEFLRNLAKDHQGTYTPIR